MRLRSLVVVGLVGIASLTVNLALAEENVRQTFGAISGVSFEDTQSNETLQASASPVTLRWGEPDAQRFAEFRADPSRASDSASTQRRYEVSIGARRSATGLPVDVSLAQRASIGGSRGGDIDREASGSELRLGRGVRMSRWEAPTWDQPAWYMFIASEDEAVTWRPGARSAFGGSASSFSLQDRVEVGDMQAGVSFEAGGVQASLAYVEREVKARSGARTFTQDENFAGLTVTMKH